MTRQNKLIVLLIYMLVLAVALLGYRANRSKKVKRLRAELAAIESNEQKSLTTEAEVNRLIKLIPVESNSAEFIETLYRCAKESGLKQHEVVTEYNVSQAPARPGAGDTSSINKGRIKISATGSFREFAEYLRRVQNIERFNRITEFRLSPDDNGLKGAITLELYSLAAQNAK